MRTRKLSSALVQEVCVDTVITCVNAASPLYTIISCVPMHIRGKHEVAHGAFFDLYDDDTSAVGNADRVVRRIS